MRWAAALLVVAACGCRREEAKPAVPAAPAPAAAVATTRHAGPEFANTPAGAARRFIYAWITGNDRLMREAIDPDKRYRVLFAVSPWVDPASRRAAAKQCLEGDVHEYQAGELITISPPGAGKVVRPVPADAIGEEIKLVSLMGRNMFVERREGKWVVAAGPIIDTLSAGFSALPTQTTSSPEMDKFVPGEEPILTPREQ